ncbi:ACT domain-containing protein [Streptomyces durbertensis]|uniref:ACT domain-containing protein n=1 Tax=Streptomyces durbertensis TaxID=2448886 RepID=A0ABR6ELK5_9ACTN|nr:ACT domain-containing protein [Streptomyces durbertensis]MBB1246216.1 ACT domain-containing protein [Streptomyces durbertensis]
MSGERDLKKLVDGMSPELQPGPYVFTTVPGEPPADVRPVVTVAEREGTTLVVPRQDADAAGLPYHSVFGWITLRVHSSLEAVGLTAVVSRALADAGLSCNVVAGYHHDHLFVPYEQASVAVAILEDLARKGS